MEIFAAALVISTFFACVTILARARLQASPPAPRSKTAQAQSAPVAGSFEERLQRIETAMPAYQLEMQAIADQALDMLETADKKRKRAAMHERRATGHVEPEEGQQPLRVIRSGTRIEPL
jgi:hypothetical protein